MAEEQGEDTVSLIRAVLDDFYRSDQPRSYSHALESIRQLVHGHSLVEDVAQVLGLAKEGLYVATGADKAVLDALELVSEGELTAWELGGGARSAVGKAELARREAEKGLTSKAIPVVPVKGRCPECNYDHETEAPAAGCLRSRTDEDLQRECLRRGFHLARRPRHRGSD